MVYKCLYCGSTSKNNDDAVSFHRFPKDQRRYLWLDSLGLSNAGMWDKICSRHFNPQHFIVDSLSKHHSSSKTVEDNLNSLNCEPSTSNNDASIWKSFWNKKKVQCQVKGKSDKQNNITHEVKENKERYQTRAITRKEIASKLNKKRKQDGDEESNKKICTRNKILEPLVENSSEIVVSFSYLKSRHLQEMKQFVDKTGGSVTDEITQCTVLVTDKIRCTMKILSAIARGCPIVNANWLKHSYTVKMFQDANDFLIVDKDAERKYQFKLKESLAKAKTKKLLDGYNVLVTPSVKPGPQEMKVIIACAGGNYVLNWTDTQCTKELIVTCDKDRNRWKPAWDNDFAKIIDSDTLVTSIIRQKLTI
ncbi:protein PF14 0175 isoform X3 [Aphis craccivora]|uniref:Protein PF14 0175 isoform X3 n=1 Tax=Aphis craccivora TaxID=307492 RepID=A0A6G0Z4W6_APHCR|nr:protein PF14 0175 isoform X3 [Aphis craccivora]